MEAPDAASARRPYLLPGERILWTGRPRHGVLFTPADIFLIPFSVLWGGFAIFWNLAVWTLDPSPNPDFRLLGLPFLVIGIQAMVGRFFHDASIRRRLIYAVTDQRVLVLRRTARQKLASMDLRHLPTLELEERRDGTGTINFNARPSIFGTSRYAGLEWWLPSLDAAGRFYTPIRDHAPGPSAVLRMAPRLGPFFAVPPR